MVKTILMFDNIETQYWDITDVLARGATSLGSGSKAQDIV